MNQVKFVEDSLKKFEGVWFKFFKDCLLQILLGPFLNTLTHLSKCPTKKIEQMQGYRTISWKIRFSFNTIVPNAHFLYPLKTKP